MLRGEVPVIIPLLVPENEMVYLYTRKGMKEMENS